MKLTLRFGMGSAPRVARRSAPGAAMGLAPRVAVALLALLLTLGGRAQGISLAGQADDDRFTFYLNEEVLVRTDYSWQADGAYQGSYTLHMAGQTATTSLAIEVDPAGEWSRMSMETSKGPVTVTRADSTAEIAHEEARRVIPLAADAILFENFNPALMRIFVDAYDAQAGGNQEFPIFIVPQVALKASLERLEPVTRMLRGRDWVFERYRLALPGVDVTLFIDEQGRVVFGDVPAQHGAYVREGFEALMAPDQVDPLLSAPEHEVRVDSGVGIPMRDGVALATDIYRPEAPGRFPVILVRTPYKKEMNELQARFYARRGYVFAVQDCRGRFGSAGEWEPFVNEAADGYDTIEWLAVQPWSTGKVGMIGASYLGWVQWWAARECPAHLATIIPNVAPPDPFYNIPYDYGTFFLLGAIWWANVLESEATGDITGERMQAVNDADYAKHLRHLPVIEIDEKILGKKNPYWRTWIEHSTNDAYWEPANFLKHLGPLDIPVFHQSGWFDGDGIGAKLNYLAMRSHGHRNQKLTLGPWGHTDTATRSHGEIDFGPDAIVDLQRDYLRWMDRWLKGIENGIDREPLVSMFVMGSNQWVYGDTYPLPQTRFTPLYLDSQGQANTSGGDGRATFEAPAHGSPPDRFVYDPGDPTPAPRADFGSAEEQENGEEEGAAAAQDGATPDTLDVDDLRAKRKAHYGELLAAREDLLVYTSEPRKTPLTIAGPVSAVLWASSSAKDTDWFMRLSIRDQEGHIRNLTEGKLRARFRHSMEAPELLVPDRIYRYELDLWHTAITFMPGEQIVVEVASASFPVFSRNLNTGGHNEMESEYATARQTIHHDADRPSHVLLPVIEEFEMVNEP